MMPFHARDAHADAAISADGDAYEKPALSVLGEVSALTLGGLGSNSDTGLSSV